MNIRDPDRNGAEAWDLLESFLNNHGPYGLSWQDTCQGKVIDIDAVVELKGDMITARAYYKRSGYWTQSVRIWTRDESRRIYWPELDIVLDKVGAQTGIDEGDAP